MQFKLDERCHFRRLNAWFKPTSFYQRMLLPWMPPMFVRKGKIIKYQTTPRFVNVGLVRDLDLFLHLSGFVLPSSANQWTLVSMCYFNRKYFQQPDPHNNHHWIPYQWFPSTRAERTPNLVRDMYAGKTLAMANLQVYISVSQHWHLIQLTIWNWGLSCIISDWGPKLKSKVNVGERS